ncbi:MAG: ATP-dependent RNA helicase HrpA [Acidimicrobiales bacterium]
MPIDRRGESELRVAARRARIPDLHYPRDLPIVERRDEILAAIRDHQVVIVAGETGSGKTTQLPKMCLELGRGTQGLIGHTQPRRIAARSVAERIAEELQSPLGDIVGYTVRFSDEIRASSLVKVMTDGILLAELRHDRLLRRYDTIIVDEAHERSLNIDFLIGFLTRLLPNRPDLKLIVTSATIDTARFSRHFGGAPVVEVSGRAYPVDIRYAPIEDGDDRDQTQAVCDTVRQLSAEGPGDVLVFLSGEREIRDTADALERLELRHTEILPLYARLSAAAQHRVFSAHPGRRVVLATNVAETSLTVPGIRYVVDPGTARISRFNRRTKVQRLPIEAISRASADQRAGRCGRVGPGICVRLYGEDDFLARPEFTEPEILRTNLASVVLQMAALDLGSPASFPFLDPPDIRSINDGINLLDELGALRERSARVRLTPTGKQLARIPIDPRLGRMMIEADRRGALREVLVIVAGLSIQDPRERPVDGRQAADELHARFRDPKSDFLAYLNLWAYLRDRRDERSSNQFRKLCRAEHLNYLRIREWQDLHSQLRQVAHELRLTTNAEPAGRDAIHASILAGLLSHIGVRDPVRPEYQGARNARFALAAGSALAKAPPRWVMAAELVETNRLWGRTAAAIDPAWPEKLGAHLVERSYGDPHWDGGQGRVVATERVTIFGLPIVAARRVDYSRIEPDLCREMFIRHALIAGDWKTTHAFMAHNDAVVDRVRALEHRARRHGILVDEEVVFAFFDQRVGTDVASGRQFDRWWSRLSQTEPARLDFDIELLLDPDAGSVEAGGYPDTWAVGEVELRLEYRFEPGHPADGVTAEIPLALLNQVSAAGFDWHVPGYRRELVTALIRSLPKLVRRHFSPAQDHADAFLARAGPAHGPLTDSLRAVLAPMVGVAIPPGSPSIEHVPDYLRITFRVVDDAGRVLGSGKDLDRLRQDLRGEARRATAAAAAGIERPDLQSWTVGDLPTSIALRRGRHTVVAFPGLVDEGDRVALRVFDDPAERDAEMWRGTRRLILLTIAPPAKALVRALSNDAKLALGRSEQATVPELLADCIHAAVDRLMADGGGPAWTETDFVALRDRVRSELPDTAIAVVTVVGRIVTAADIVERRLAGIRAASLGEGAADMRTQLAGLVYPGFAADVGAARLPDVLRYVRGMQHRLDKMAQNPARDLQHTRTVQELADRYDRALRRLPPEGREIRWMLEELRIGLFAQTMGTSQPVSPERVARALDRLVGA